MFRRGKSKTWYYHHPVTGRKVSSGTSDKERAKALYRQLEQESFDRKVGRFVDTWDTASARWMELHAHLANYRCQQDYEKFWTPLLSGMKLNEIDEEYVHECVMRGRPGVSLKERVSANATANLYVWYVAKILRFGKVAPPKFHKYPSPKPRKNWLRPEEWAVLRAKLPDDLRRVCTFSIATGLRMSNVIGFRWEWLHGADDRAYLPPDVTKTDEAYGIPLNRTARDVIAEIRRLPVRHQTHVFTTGGQPWEATITEALKRACKRAGLAEVGMHGLRHTFASWLAMEGVSDSIRRRLGCWQASGGADARYVHFDVEKLRRFAEVLDPLLNGEAHGREAAAGD